jgi:hypothetical protein
MKTKKIEKVLAHLLPTVSLENYVQNYVGNVHFDPKQYFLITKVTTYTRWIFRCLLKSCSWVFILPRNSTGKMKVSCGRLPNIITWASAKTYYYLQDHSAKPTSPLCKSTWPFCKSTDENHFVMEHSKYRL